VSDLDKLRTRVANQAHEVAKTINEGFDDYRLGAGAWQVELSAPEGQSTAGGKQALQHLRLVPTREGYAALVVGTVNGVLSTAEVRTFEHVALGHELRFKRPLEITADEYDDFLRKADVIMNLCRFKVKRVGPPEELLAERAQLKVAAHNARNLKIGAAVVGLLIAAMIVVRFALG